MVKTIKRKSFRNEKISSIKKKINSKIANKTIKGQIKLKTPKRIRGRKNLISSGKKIKIDPEKNKKEETKRTRSSKAKIKKEESEKLISLEENEKNQNLISEEEEEGNDEKEEIKEVSKKKSKIKLGVKRVLRSKTPVKSKKGQGLRAKTKSLSRNKRKKNSDEVSKKKISSNDEKNSKKSKKSKTVSKNSDKSSQIKKKVRKSNKEIIAEIKIDDYPEAESISLCNHNIIEDCCLECNEKNLIRAINTDDKILFNKCLNSVNKISSINKGIRIAGNLTPLQYIVKKRNKNLYIEFINFYNESKKNGQKKELVCPKIN